MDTVTAFAGERLIAAGERALVALAVKRASAQRSDDRITVFDDVTGRVVDFDLRGSDEDVVARYSPLVAAEAPRGAGRPRLGVVAREVTLLPRHWDWLNAQPDGASATLRRLVDAARSADGDRTQKRQALQAADRVMMVMAGDHPGYEEASRALYAGDAPRFYALIAEWPAEVKAYVERLAAPLFAADAAVGEG